MIYFIQESGSGLIKIGCTERAVEGRLSMLQIGNPHPLRVLLVLPGSYAEERRLHRQFRPARHLGEWFHPYRMILGFVHDHVDESLYAVVRPLDLLGVGHGLEVEEISVRN